jgi:hypothetical protein
MLETNNKKILGCYTGVQQSITAMNTATLDKQVCGDNMYVFRYQLR